jgi:hypothetical protein
MMIAFLRPRQTWMFFGYATRKAATQQFVPLPPQKNDFKGEIDLDMNAHSGILECRRAAECEKPRWRESPPP